MGRIINEGSLPPDDPIFSGGAEMFSPRRFRPSTSDSPTRSDGARPASFDPARLERTLDDPKADASDIGLAMAASVTTSLYTPPDEMVEIVKAKRPDVLEQATKAYRNHWHAANF